MTLLTGLLFGGLAGLACIAYLAVESWHQAELIAERQLARLYREALRQEALVAAQSQQLRPSGFFKVGSAGPDEQAVGLDAQYPRADADWTSQHCA